MEIKIVDVPTGKIGIMEGDKGLIEFLSIGDYGRDSNVKADFLGLNRPIYGVPNGEIMPLSEKWVVTVSTQYGCAMNCKFCDVPKVGVGINATKKDLLDQITNAIDLYPDVSATKRLNIHYARMGEPTFNRNVLQATKEVTKHIRSRLGRSLVHPVISTMLPRKNRKLMEFLNEWTIDIKNERFRGNAGLQFSINSTSNKQREFLFSKNSHNIEEISKIGKHLVDPIGRKYALNFALADNSEVDAIKLKRLFDPKKFMVKITPLHETNACKGNNIHTTDGYTSFVPYEEVEKRLKNEGFDVLVFVPSADEESGRITCGNAILSDKNTIYSKDVLNDTARRKKKRV